MNRLRPKLTFANVMSVIAVFIALGGTSYAISKLPKNSVGPKQLKKNSVTTAKLKNQSVTASKVKNGTLTGAQINASTLGTVPNAAGAQSLGGLSADQIEQSSKLHCPAGAAPAGGVCFETSERPPAVYITALETCAMVNRSLPTEGELVTYLVTQSETLKEWAGPHYLYGGAFWASVVSGNADGVSLSSSEVKISNAFRCVTGPEN